MTLVLAIPGEQHKEGTVSPVCDVHTRAKVVSKNQQPFELRLGVAVASSGRARPLPSKQPVLMGASSALRG